MKICDYYQARYYFHIKTINKPISLIIINEKLYYSRMFDSHSFCQ